ncbi:uncharacterized protein [Arachis hypogaea]|uniref:uncharacterized protein n=1 Tax=Arachis hypogaea TaxID=3818 RepID=UPI003B225509
MAFLLPTTINKIPPVHLTPIFEMDSITERNWGGHVLSFIVKGITDYKEKKKKNECRNRKNFGDCKDGTNKRDNEKNREKRKKKTRNQKKKKRKASSTSSSETETTDSDSSTSESETQEDSEDSPRKQPSKKGKKTQSKKKKVVVEHSSSEEDQYYDGYNTSENEADLRSTEGRYVSSETIPDVNLESDDPSSQGRTEQSSVNKPAESMLSPVQQSASEPADSNMMVVREETPSEGLAILPIQVFVPVSQTTTVPEFEETPETDFEPTPLLQIEGTTKTTPESPPTT